MKLDGTFEFYLYIQLGIPTGRSWGEVPMILEILNVAQGTCGYFWKNTDSKSRDFSVIISFEVVSKSYLDDNIERLSEYPFPLKRHCPL